jgi:hypothetical protein
VQQESANISIQMKTIDEEHEKGLGDQLHSQRSDNDGRANNGSVEDKSAMVMTYRMVNLFKELEDWNEIISLFEHQGAKQAVPSSIPDELLSLD